MWTILKIDKKKFKLLKLDFEKKLGKELKFYNPKIKIQKFQKNNYKDFEVDILGNYLFCFHKSFEKKNVMSSLQYSRGLKYFLEGFTQSQREINLFINKCKNYEDDKGFLSSSFFSICFDKNYKFFSGPFTERIFKVINLQKNKIEILMGQIKTTIDRKNFLFKPV